MHLRGLVCMQPDPDTSRCGPYLSMEVLLLLTWPTVFSPFSGVDTPLRLVTLFRDKEPHQEPVNPRLTTWEQDLSQRLQELEEAAAVSTHAFSLAITLHIAKQSCCFSLLSSTWGMCKLTFQSPTSCKPDNR